MMATETPANVACSLRRGARAALLESKRVIDSLSKSRREELLSSAAVSEKRDLNEKVTDDALMAASDDVTHAMQRTMTMLQGELERSVFSAQTLADSTATLRSASSTHDTLTSVMDTSKHLITALEKSDWLDRVVIFAALLFFFLVVLFILKQRVFDRGMRVAFWWTRFVPDFSGDAQLLSMEKGSGSLTALSTTLLTSSVSAATLVASSVASAASVLASSSAVDPTPLPEPTPEIFLDVVPEVSDIHEEVVADTETSSVPEPIPGQTVHVEL
ncbi:Sec20-domain-containing protein [Mycena rosella]|uniref:Sec20-domain-containing protein n=1 Tax=Mycena rosella TaxID=1033263 RepID=A0AAD7GFN6_MYCRO|nr:Sec20-domain-containing protein [Mycena rosella]